MSIKAPFGIPDDKWQHYIVGCAIALPFMPFIGFWFTALLVFVVATSWEIYQKVSKKGVFDLMDIVATFLAVPTVWLLLKLIGFIFKLDLV